MRHRRARRSRALAAAALLPFANAEPARCRKVPTDNSTAAASSRFDYGERYLDIVKCGGLSLLVSRLQPNLKEMAWVTIARLWQIMGPHHDVWKQRLAERVALAFARARAHALSRSRGQAVARVPTHSRSRRMIPTSARH